MNMATALSFTKTSGGHWEASFTSSGDRIAVEVNRVASGPLIVCAAIDSMNKKTVQDFGPGADADMIFEVDVPEGITITVISFTEVKTGKATDV